MIGSELCNSVSVQVLNGLYFKTVRQCVFLLKVFSFFSQIVLRNFRREINLTVECYIYIQ